MHALESRGANAPHSHTASHTRVWRIGKVRATFLLHKLRFATKKRLTKWMREWSNEKKWILCVTHLAIRYKELSRSFCVCVWLCNVSLVRRNKNAIFLCCLKKNCPPWAIALIWSHTMFQTTIKLSHAFKCSTHFSSIYAYRIGVMQAQMCLPFLPSATQSCYCFFFSFLHDLMNDLTEIRRHNVNNNEKKGTFRGKNGKNETSQTVTVMG